MPVCGSIRLAATTMPSGEIAGFRYSTSRDGGSIVPVTFAVPEAESTSVARRCRRGRRGRPGCRCPEADGVKLHEIADRAPRRHTSGHDFGRALDGEPVQVELLGDQLRVADEQHAVWGSESAWALRCPKDRHAIGVERRDFLPRDLPSRRSCAEDEVTAVRQELRILRDAHDAGERDLNRRAP